MKIDLTRGGLKQQQQPQSFSDTKNFSTYKTTSDIKKYGTSPKMMEEEKKMKVIKSLDKQRETREAKNLSLKKM